MAIQKPIAYDIWTSEDDKKYLGSIDTIHKHLVYQ